MKIFFLASPELSITTNYHLFFSVPLWLISSGICTPKVPHLLLFLLLSVTIGSLPEMFAGDYHHSACTCKHTWPRLTSVETEQEKLPPWTENSCKFWDSPIYVIVRVVIHSSKVPQSKDLPVWTNLISTRKHFWIGMLTTSWCGIPVFGNYSQVSTAVNTSQSPVWDFQFPFVSPWACNYTISTLFGFKVEKNQSLKLQPSVYFMNPGKYLYLNNSLTNMLLRFSKQCHISDKSFLSCFSTSHCQQW